jgi:hypothetical protein
MPNDSTQQLLRLFARRSSLKRSSQRFVASLQPLESREVLSPPTIPGTPVLTDLGQNSATIS